MTLRPRVGLLSETAGVTDADDEGIPSATAIMTKKKGRNHALSCGKWVVKRTV